MSTQEKVLNRLKYLPEHLQISVLEYVDLLIENFNERKSIAGESPDITEEQQNVLAERHEKYANDPWSGEVWEKVRANIVKKYAV
jgi:hypothetical protein